MISRIPDRERKNPTSRSKILMNSASFVPVKSRFPPRYFLFSRIPHSILVKSRIPKIPWVNPGFSPTEREPGNEGAIKVTFYTTVEPLFNEPFYNEIEVLGMTNYFFQPGQNYNKMYGTERRFNEILVKNTIRKCNRKIFYNYSHEPRLR